jgi:hypothetical protein
LGNPPGFNQSSTTPGGGNAKNPVSGLKATQVNFDNVSLTWNASANAKSYNVTAKDGSKTVSKQTVSGTSARIGGLKQKTHYTISVWASPSPGGATASVRVTTK